MNIKDITFKDAAQRTVVSLPACLWLSYLYMTLWSWFVVPLGADELGMAHAYGLAICVHAVTHDSNITRDYPETAVEGIIESLLRTGIMLGAGWVAHAIMVSS